MNRIRKKRKAAVVLASESPRRRDLLTSIGIPFEIIPASVDEALINGESPESHVCRLARAKAHDVAARIGNRWVIGADTIVVIDGRVLGKPENRTQAISMLKVLQARTHEVYTGYAILNSYFPDREVIRCVRSEVSIRNLTEDEVRSYVQTGEPMDKAGAYAIQGIGSGIVQSVSGSYTNVVGLPLCEVAQDLKELGIFDFLKVPHGLKGPTDQ